MDHVYAVTVVEDGKVKFQVVFSRMKSAVERRKKWADKYGEENVIVLNHIIDGTVGAVPAHGTVISPGDSFVLKDVYNVETD